MRPDRVAEAVITAFIALPRKAKPRVVENGRREWTTLAGIVLSHKGHEDQPFVAALGTGMRCLPASKLPLAAGRCLHDWHAEVVAMRAFNAFLLAECQKLAKSDTVADGGATGSQWLQTRARVTEDDPQPFAINRDVHIAMYVSEAPCGDASMELVMRAQKDATPWARRKSTGEADHTALAGRADFSKLGVVRRKPARADAPLTNSKSCSDKLSMKQCTSLLSSLASLFVHPGSAYLHALVIPDDQIVEKAMTRCFSHIGRMATCLKEIHPSTAWTNTYFCYGFDVQTTSTSFDYSRTWLQDWEKSSGSNITAVWTPHHFEVLIAGTKSGFKQFSERGASVLSRAAMWAQSLELARALDDPALTLILDQPTYADVKGCERLARRRQAKADVKSTSLRGWTSNGGDESFSIPESTW